MVSVFTAKVTGGVIVADDVDLPEGATVTVTVDDADSDDYATLTADEERELETALAEGDRGEGVPWDVLRADLRQSRS